MMLAGKGYRSRKNRDLHTEKGDIGPLDEDGLVSPASDGRKESDGFAIREHPVRCGVATADEYKGRLFFPYVEVGYDLPD
jgi:hypothetical protein